MALRYLNKDLIKTYLTAMWKKELNTTQDPAGDGWYETHPPGDMNFGEGLYGGLKDTLVKTVEFHEPERQYVSEESVCYSVELDNRNGAMPKAPAGFSDEFSSTVSVTHTKANSILAGIGMELKVEGKFGPVGVEASASTKLEYTHSWEDSDGKTATTTRTVSVNPEVEIPAGRVYEVIFLSTTATTTIPYTATIAVTGGTQTWLKERINGLLNHGMTAGDAFKKIGEWGLAGEDSPSYTAAGVVQTGTVTAQKGTKLRAMVVDITDIYKPSKTTSKSKAPKKEKDSLIPRGAKLVKEIPFPNAFRDKKGKKGGKSKHKKTNESAKEQP